MAMLEVKDLQVYYGVIQAISGISFEVNKGEIVTLIGANGAGKTTTMQSIMGLIPIRSGSVFYEGQNITKAPCHKIVSLGMTQCPEGRRIFQELSVYDNLLMGAFAMKDKKGIKDDIEKIYTRFPRLEERKNQIAGTLSGGEQQMLAMGRGLMADPDLLLLDEPSLGLAPILIQTIFDVIQKIKSMGKTILLVEQNAYQALEVSDRAYVLEQGHFTLNGPAAEVLADPIVQQAYLGKKK